MSSPNGGLNFQRMMKTAQAIFLFSHGEIELPNEHIRIRQGGGGSLKAFPIQLQCTLFVMLCQQLKSRSLDRAFASFALHGTDERHLFHHQLMECRLRSEEHTSEL